MSPVTSVHLLGAVEVFVDGAPPPPELLWRKHLAVALVLWCDRGRPVARDRLIGLLWADRPEGAARHSLNEALRVVRRACGADAIRSTPDAVTWTADLECDVDRFRDSAETDPLRAAALVRGAWCEGFVVPECPAFESWCEGERDRWRGPLVATLARASALALDRGDVATALPLAEGARALHPWSEHGVLAVMRARVLAGDRAGAIAAGKGHVRELASELGAEASGSVTRLLATLQDDAVDSPAAEMPPAPAFDPRPPWIERGGALPTALRLARQAVAGGHGVAVLCVGPAGSGRSRVLVEVAARLRLEGTRVIAVRAVPGDAAAPHGGLEALADGIARAPVAVAGAPPEAIAALAALRPSWADRFPNVAAARSLPLDSALLSVLHAITDEGPLCLVIDDLDRLAPPAVAALAVLMRELAERPLVWIMSAESGVVHHGVDDLARLLGDELHGTTVTTVPLDDGVTAALVDWAVPDWEDDARARLMRRIVVEAGGSIFIAVELLTAVRHGFGLPEPQARWPARGRTLDDTLPAGTPMTLTLALRHAFGRLDVAAQRLLQRLAVGPEPFTEAVRGEVPVELLDRLERERWLASDARGYQIAARGVRRFIEQDTLTPGQRRRLLAERGTPPTP